MSKLIISKTPLRISLNGGGTDFEDYYIKKSGLILSTTIDKNIFVTVKEHGELFNEKIRLNYSETEVVSEFDDIQNEIARECLKFVDVPKSVYISTISDIPSQSGLGSSSSFAVGLLNALFFFKGEKKSPRELAEMASFIEINVLGNPIGKQDQYAAAYGGLNIFKFKTTGEVIVENLSRSKYVKEIFDNSLFFWTGITRSATSVLKSQKENIQKNMENLDLIKKFAIEASELIKNDFDIVKFGILLDDAWTQKKKLSNKISNSNFDSIYLEAKKNGALGGKILGAGGGGFFMIVALKEHHKKIKKVFSNYKKVNFGFQKEGSEILYSNAK